MSPSELTLEMFAEHLRYTNPFDENRVTQTDSLTNDVPAIHAEAFEQLTLRARKAAQNPEMGSGVVVTGPPGVGKSHLLARFGEWARQEKHPFIYLLNLQAGPADILRTILRTSLSILTKGMAKSPGQTRLYRLISATINHALDLKKLQGVDLQTAYQAYETMVNRLEGETSIYRVLWLLFDDLFRQLNGRPGTGRALLAKRWLSGNFLDLDEALQLGLKGPELREDGCALDLEQMKEVIKVLCQLAGFRRRSFILCFDQVDTLTEDQVQSWSATTHALLDICPRLLVVTSGVDDTFIEWTRQKLVPQSSWDRIRQFSLNLSGIDAKASQMMIQDRLQRSLQRFGSLPEIAQRINQDSLFPLGRTWGAKIFYDQNGDPQADLRPRHIINQAGSAWDRESHKLAQLGVTDWLASWPDPGHQENAPSSLAPIEIDLPSLIDQRVTEKLNEHRQSRLLRPEELPVDAGNVVGLIRSILKACEQAGPPYQTEQYARFGGIVVSSSKIRKKPAFQLVVEQLPDSPSGLKRVLGISVAEASSGTAATNMLKRILAELEAPTGAYRALLIVDARDPLQLAEAGQAYLDKLKSYSNRFTMQSLDFEQYATLESFEAVVGLARSGDLEAVPPDGLIRPISEREVYESHHRHQRYLSPLILCQILGKCTDVMLPQVPELDRQRVIEATYAQLAINLGLTTLQLASWWIEHQQPRPDESCHAAVHNMFKEVVLKLHAEGKVCATALNDYYMVQPTNALFEVRR